MATFSTLWVNHPTIKGTGNPCVDAKGNPNFSDQCAIRLAVSLVASGVPLASFQKTAKLCWHHPQAAGHVIRAEELANDLATAVVPGMSGVLKLTGKSFKAAISDKTGIVFFKDYWARAGESKSRSGDHIDLWNGSRLTDWTTWFRIQAGISWDGVWSDFSKSSKVWFWQVS